MKKTLRPMLLLLSVMATSSMILLSCDSYERRMAKFKKTATEYKKTLGPNNQIIAERIDSIVQKVYYAIDDDGDGACENIKIHNYATGKTKLILPESGKIEDYKFCGVAYSKSKLIADRLFLEVVSNCMCEICDHGIFYVDVRNDSLHYVEQCTSADFDGSNKLNIHKTYYVGEDKYGSPINKSKDYTLSTSLSDEAYTDNRREQKKIEERLAEEWREQEKTRRRDEVKTWLVGIWESKGWDEWIGRYTSYVCITENNLRFGYNGQDIYNGPYEIDMESHSIIFDRHDGYYTHIGFNPQTKRLEDEDGVFRKVSNCGNVSYNSSSYEARNGNNYSTINFRTDTDVISYTSSHTFKNNVGNRIKINFQGMYVNGSLLTNAPRVLNFSGSSATISVSSPYTGGGALIIKVDASRGTITDGSGDVFRMVN